MRQSWIFGSACSVLFSVTSCGVWSGVPCQLEVRWKGNVNEGPMFRGHNSDSESWSDSGPSPRKSTNPGIWMMLCNFHSRHYYGLYWLQELSNSMFIYRCFMGKEKLAPAVKVDAEQTRTRYESSFTQALRLYNYQGSILIPLTAKFFRELYIFLANKLNGVLGKPALAPGSLLTTRIFFPN